MNATVTDRMEQIYSVELSESEANKIIVALSAVLKWRERGDYNHLDSLFDLRTLLQETK